MSKMTTVTNEWRKMRVIAQCKSSATDDFVAYEVEADVMGCFAVHRSTTQTMDWALTHIPTGRLVHRYDMAQFSKNDVSGIASSLHALHGDEWNTESLGKTRNLLLTCKDIWQLEAVQS